MKEMPRELDPDVEDVQGEAHVRWTVWLVTLAFFATIGGGWWFENAVYLRRHHDIEGSFMQVTLWIIGLGP